MKHENDRESLFQRAFSVQYNGKKMKKYVIIFISIIILLCFISD
jgi:hypothetical protein